MTIYSVELKRKIRDLRTNGLTYSEIQDEIGQAIPKGSLTYICKGIKLKPEQQQRILEIMRSNAELARSKAVLANKQILQNKLEQYAYQNSNLVGYMQDRKSQLVALAMLYLGEGAKWQTSRAPKLASSSPQIIKLYIDLLKNCYGVEKAQLRCRVQHRADQSSSELVKFWSQVTGVSSKKFYPSYIDKRSVGKPTTKPKYRGVCTVASAGTHIQLELKEIADIISSAV